MQPVNGSTAAEYVPDNSSCSGEDYAEDIFIEPTRLYMCV